MVSQKKWGQKSISVGDSVENLIHQRYLCLANYEDKMWGNRTILVLIREEMEAMANVKESQINIEKSTNVWNITCTYTKIWTVL